MAPKPNTRSWYDIQMTIAAISMSTMLMLWNLFAGPDREKADRKIMEATQIAVLPPAEVPDLFLTPTPITKIFFTNTTLQPSSTSSQPSTSRTKKDRSGSGGGGGSKAAGGGGGSTGAS